MPAASIFWNVVGGNGHVEQASTRTDKDGTLSAVWVLGTLASDVQKLTAEAVIGSHHVEGELQASAVPVEVAALRILTDTTDARLTVAAQLHAEATDPFGNHFVPTDLRFASLDTTLVVDSAGVAVAHRRGFARVMAAAGGHADTAVVHGVQVVAAIQVDRDTLLFHSLGQAQTLKVTLVDDQGLTVTDSLPAVAPSDPTIVAVRPDNPLAIQSVANGRAAVQLQAGSVGRQVVTLVQQRTATLEFTVPSFSFDALNDTVRSRLIILDSLGVPVQMPHITFSSSDTSVVAVDSAGLLRARRNGSVTMRAQALSGVVATVPADVVQRVAKLAVARDTVSFDALHAVLPTGAVGLDRLGSPVVGATLTYASENNGIVTVRADGQVEALANGTTHVTAAHGLDSATTVVRVQQRPVRVVLAADTIRLTALGDTRPITAVAVDSLGYQVSGGVSGVAIADPAVAVAIDSATVKAVGNGSTTGQVTVAGVVGNVVVLVRQVAASIQVALDSGAQIVILPADSQIPVTCRVWDRNGQAMRAVPVVAPSNGDRWIGNSCDELRIRRSGFDTLRVTVDTVAVSVPIVLAVRPVVSSAVGDIINVDSFPSGTTPWAPTARLAQGGGMEIYVALGDTSSPVPRNSLHRFESLDGVHFAYDGLVLDHDADSCALNGTGIENVAIAQRAEAAGWRMYYAAGSNDCYGWQVFSAVSADGRVWVKEPGIRLSNGGPVPPAPPSTPPWPVGEGMVVNQLPTGEWRMIVGSYEHVLPTVDKWQIAEWHSSDQLTWSYVGTVLTTRDMPAEGQGSVYSPTIVEFAPGLWRMIFTGDNRGTGQEFRSRLWSAVSVDEVHWHVEGEVMGAPGTDLYYSTLAGNRLAFVRQDAGQPPRLGIATITMP